MNESYPRPPKLAEWLLSRVVDPDIRYSALGDFEEQFRYRVNDDGLRKATLWYWLQALRSLPKFVTDSIYWRVVMFKNYLKVAIRNLLKQRVYSFINISGLAIGIACAIIILLWVQEEISYDGFHDKADRIYRVGARGVIGDTYNNQTGTPAPLAVALKNDFPEIEQTVRFRSLANIFSRYGEKVFNEEKMVFADSTLFEVFSFKLIKGDAKTVLVEPLTIVMTEETAKRYFGDEDPIGKVIALNDQFEARVTGVMENIPDNSHFHPDIFLSMSSSSFSNNTRWMSNSFKTYVVLRDGHRPEQLEAKFPDLIKQSVYANYPDMFKGDSQWEYFLQPLTDIHLHSDLTSEFETNGSSLYVHIFSGSAILILLIACINFMNLATARSANRAKEVGLRKVVGSSRGQLVFQHLTESFSLVLIALALAVILIDLTIPYFNAFIEKNLEFSVSKMFFQLLALILFVGLFSGSYPAFYLSAFRPVSVITGKLRQGMKNSVLRNIMVVFQFAATITLFIGTLVIARQLDFFQSKRLGFNKEQVVVIKRAGQLGDELSAFKNALREYADIVSVSGSFTVPGRDFNNMVFWPEGKESITLDIARVDPEFRATMQLEMTKGRFFSDDFATDSNGMILNEAALNLLQWHNPIGKTISPGGDVPYKVIGVAKDFHYQSLHSVIRPMALITYGGPLTFTDRYITARVRTENTTETIENISTTWNSLTDGKPFEYSFLDDDYQSLYRSEMQTAKIFSGFSILAVIIAGLGLLGLALFTAEQRTREIGIRKVLGASASSIFILLSREFVKWVVVANLIAWPVAYFLMNRWLEDFAYRITFSWTPFVLSAIIALAISLLTVSYQSLKVAGVNPSVALRDE